MFKPSTLTSLLGLVVFVSPAWSQTSHSTHAIPATASTPAVTTAWAEGEVRKIDQTQLKITLRHGEIANLNMPPMTMAFKVADAALLEQVKVGDRVRFMAMRSGQDHVITAMTHAH